MHGRMHKTMTGKMLSLFLAFMMLFSTFTVTASALDDDDASSGTKDASGWWSSYADTTWYDGTSDTFTIKTAEELAGLASLVNGGNNFSGKTINLGANIDLSAHYWVPIGGNRGISGNTPSGTAFAGTFNGGIASSDSSPITNRTVSGMQISWNIGGTNQSNSAITDSGNYAGFGLFGVVSGVVKNVNVSGSITSDARMYAVGGVVGYATGSVFNCRSAVTINITNDTAARTGGVVGDMKNSTGNTIYLQYCANTATVTGARQVGGIVGEATCTSAGGIQIDHCYDTGTVNAVVTGGTAAIGGLVGETNAYIDASYMRASLSSNGGVGMGGLVGVLRGASPAGRVTNCYTMAIVTKANVGGTHWLFGSVTGNNNTMEIADVLWATDYNDQNRGVSGITQEIATGANNLGYWTNVGIAGGLTLQQNYNAIVYTSTGSGYNTNRSIRSLTVLGDQFRLDNVSDALNNTYPILAWQRAGVTASDFGGHVPSTGTGTSTDPWQISTKADLENIRSYLVANDGYEGKYFKIMKDIELDSSWTGIGNPTLSSASTNSPYVSGGMGFAGNIDGNGQTLTINRTIDSVETTDTAIAAGSFINYLAPAGTIKNITVTGKMTVASAAADGVGAVGGIVGYNSGTINNVTNSVTVTASDCYNVGGVAGFNDNFYVKGAIGVIQNSKNSGNISGYQKIGGIAGENAGLIASCSNSGAVATSSSRRSGAGGIAGRNGNNNTALETGRIWCSYNSGNISNADSSWIGGIAGYQNKLSNISNCYDTGNVSGYTYAGLISGDNDKGSEVSDSYHSSTANIVVPSTGTVGNNGDLYDSSKFSDLDSADSSYGTWSNANAPVLSYDANATTSGALGWANQPKEIYLNPKATSDGDGTQSSPYKDLDNAVTAANGGTVYIMDTVELTGGNYYYSVTFKRDAACTGPMFSVNAPTGSNGSITYVTFTSATIDGNGTGTLIEVVEGRLRMRGNLKLQNADIGVLVDAEKLTDGTLALAQAEIDYASIDTTLAAKVAGASTGTTNDLILNSFGADSVNINGVVSLAENAYITVYNTVTCDVTVECANPVSATKIATGTVPSGAGYSYTLQSSDVAKFKYVGNACDMTLSNNNINLNNCYVYYLNGTASENGSGTQDSPFNSLSSALSAAGTDKLILVSGTTALSGESYSGSATIQRSAGFTDNTMFTAAASGTTLSGLTILGRCVGSGTPEGTILNVANSGAVTLASGVTLKNCSVAVDVSSGAAVTVTNAIINAAQYSIKLASDTSTFTLTPATGTEILGTVYLPEDAYIRVGSALTSLTGTVTVECEEADDGIDVARAVGSTFNEFSDEDAEKLVYIDDSYEIVVDENNIAKLVLKN